MRFSFFTLSPLLWAATQVLAGKLSPTDTITWGGDNSRCGYQTGHNMDPAVVGSDQFGLLWKAPLPGNYHGFSEQVYSQPLVYTLNDGIQYLFVATTQNNVYKINAKTGAVVLSRNMHVPFLTADLDGCVDINPTVGVTATGVIDPSTDTWYLTAKTYVDQSDVVKGRLNGRYYMHAIDVNTLAEKPGFPRNLEGTIARNNANRMFQGGNAHQRPGLLLAGQYVYAGFASHCVQYNYTGWVMGWDKTTGDLVEKFTLEAGPEPNTTPGAGIWMSGGGIASDDKGAMYFATGNGYSAQQKGIPIAGRQPPSSLEEAVVNMRINDDGSLAPLDFFMPWEKQQLDGADKDLGTTPFELLPTSTFTCPNVKRMGVVTGKSGKTYILNLDNLGGYQNGPNKLDAIPQSIQNENSVYSGAGVYPLEGGYIYVNVIQYQTHAFKFSCDANGDPKFTKVADTPEKAAYVLGVGHGTTTSLNGQDGTGLLWVTDVDGFNLRVYKAVPGGSTLELIQAANLPGLTKFTRAVFGDGRVYLGTTQGFIYCLGSPVNPPLTCNSPLDFGSTSINSTSAPRTIQCTANIQTRVTNINLTSNANFKISGLPSLPATLSAGSNISFQAVFAPVSPGPLSRDIQLNTINDVAGYSTTTPVSLKGVGTSADPLLAVSPNVISFEGVITGEQAGGVTQSIIISNVGDGPLTIQSFEYSVISETGATVTSTNTPDGPKVSAFTFQNLPTNISGNSQAVVDINFNPPTSGNFAVYVRIRSNGGIKVFDVFGTAGTFPKALVEFQAADGSDTWIPYQNNTPFTFGNVFEQQTKALKLRLTNVGDETAASLSVTVSKPPFGVDGIIGALNGVDLGEGTVLAPGQSATASLFCSVPKSQVNVDSYQGTARWTMNTGDPTLGKLFMQFVCNAVSEQVGPLYGNGSAIYRSVGCFKENNPGRQLKTQLYNDPDNNTNAKCITACAAQSYTYAGTQYRSECWCGNTIPNTNVSNAECNFDCSGALKETCGGNGVTYDGSFISLFTNKPGRDIPSGPPKVPKSVGPYNYTGCYTEAAPHALGDKITATADMTIETCAAFCAGYQYFGLEYANECYCGNTLTAGSTKAPETDCKMSCAGNNGQLCGAGGRLTLYTLSGAAPESSSSSTGPQSATVSISATSSGNTPSSTGPAAVLAAGKFNFTGCYTEGNGVRALSGAVNTDPGMTVEKCAAFCAAYTYMGVEYSTECYCGNTINTGAVQTKPESCSMLCGGNPQEYCGGPALLNFYKAAGGPTSTAAATTAAPSPTGPIIVKGDANFTYSACYVEPVNGRALPNQILPGAVMTVQKCLSACAQFQYAGLEYGGECWCGNTLAAGTIKATAESQCSLTCSGNSTQICGDGNRLTLYTHIPAGSSAVSSSSLSSSTSINSASSSSSFSSSVVSPLSSSSSATASVPSSISSATPAISTSVGSSVSPAVSSSVKNSVTSAISSSLTSSIASGFSSSIQNSITSAVSSTVQNSITSVASSTLKSSVTSSVSLSVTSSATPVSSSSVQSSVTPIVSSSVKSSITPAASLSVTSSATPVVSSSVKNSVSSIVSSSIKSSITLSVSSSISGSVTPAVSSSIKNSITPAVSSSIKSSITSPISSSINSSVTPAVSSSIKSSITPAVSSSIRSSVTSLVSSSVKQNVFVAVSSSAKSSVTPKVSSTVKSSVIPASSSAKSSVTSKLSSTVKSSVIPASSSAKSSVTPTISSTVKSFVTPVSSIKTSVTPAPSSTLKTSVVSGTSSKTQKVSSPSTLQTSKSKSPSSSVKSSSTAVRFVPTPGQTVGSYVYLGCANETSPRALVGISKTDSTGTTTKSCQQLCFQNNYGLAATENGNTCFCGNGLQSSSTLGQKFCNAPCAGNSSETCGGIDGSNNKYLSVWNSTSSAIPPTMVKQVGKYPLDNCYSDSNTTRALTGSTLTKPTTMTVEACVNFCITKNYPLAGLSYGKTCFCGQSLATTAKVIPLAQCNMLCTGNRREFCGAYQKLLVYKEDLTSVDANGVPKAMGQPNLASIKANTTSPA